MLKSKFEIKLKNKANRNWKSVQLYIDFQCDKNAKKIHFMLKKMSNHRRHWFICTAIWHCSLMRNDIKICNKFKLKLNLVSHFFSILFHIEEQCTFIISFSNNVCTVRYSTVHYILIFKFRYILKMSLLKKDKSNFKLEIRKKTSYRTGTHNVTEIDYFLIFISVIYRTMGSVWVQFIQYIIGKFTVEYRSSVCESSGLYIFVQIRFSFSQNSGKKPKKKFRNHYISIQSNNQL